MAAGQNYHTVDGRRHSFTFKIDQLDNGTFMASVVHEKQRNEPDDLGALYYVVAVLLIYGCSILMMLASYVRKNKMDQKLNKYHKEMINVRKRERQIQLCNAAKKAAAANAKLEDAQSVLEKKLSNISENSGNNTIDGHFHGDKRERESDREKMYLDLPTSTYNTDSDNETSTEGELCYLPAVSKPAKSILKSTKSVTLVVPPAGEVLKPIWPSCDSDSCYSGEPSPNLDHKDNGKQFDVSFV